MKILRLCPEHFGKFNNADIRLFPGINVIYGTNESGKSTLYSFLGAMLFGTGKKRGRAKEDLSQKYLPWDFPDRYCGSLELWHEGKTYVFKRTFLKNATRITVTCRETGRVIADKDITKTGTDNVLGKLVEGLDESAYKNILSISGIGSAAGDEAVKLIQLSLMRLGNREILQKGIDVNAAAMQLKKTLRKLKKDMAANNSGELLAELEKCDEKLGIYEQADKNNNVLSERVAVAQKEKERLNIQQRNTFEAYRLSGQLRTVCMEFVREYREYFGLACASEAYIKLKQEEQVLYAGVQSDRVHLQSDVSETGRQSHKNVQGYVTPPYDSAEENYYQGYGAQLYDKAGKNENQNLAPSLYDNAERDRSPEQGASLYDNTERGRSQEYAAQQYDSAERSRRQKHSTSSYNNAKGSRQHNRGLKILRVFSFITAFIIIAAGFYISQTGKNTSQGETVLESSFATDMILPAAIIIGIILIVVVFSVTGVMALRHKEKLLSEKEQALENAGTVIQKEAIQEATIQETILKEAILKGTLKEAMLTEAMLTEAVLKETLRKEAGVISYEALEEQLQKSSDRVSGLEKSFALICQRISETGVNAEQSAVFFKRTGDIAERLGCAEDKEQCEMYLSSMNRITEEFCESIEKCYENIMQLVSEADNRIDELRQLVDKNSAISGNADSERNRLDSIRKKYDEQVQLKKQQMERYEAIEIACEALELATRQLHDSLGTDFNHIVSEYSVRLTGGAVDRVVIDEAFNINIYRNDRLIPVDRLSSGTAAQVYLAVRLALGEVLFEGTDVPFIFDDAFAMYDDVRLKETLRCLIGLGRQIIIFSCQQREAELLEEIGTEYGFTDISEL